MSHVVKLFLGGSGVCGWILKPERTDVSEFVELCYRKLKWSHLLL